MARALECPACGSRTPLNALPDAPTFRCERCGQVLKVPANARSQPKPAPKPAPNPAPKPGPNAGPKAAARRAPAPAPAPAPTGDQQPPPRRSPGTPAAAAAAAATTPSGAAPPPPPRRGGGVSGGVPAGAVSSAAAAAVSASVHPDAPAAAPPSADAPSRGRRADRADARPAPKAAPVPGERRRVRWYWRLLAWVVAVPLGFLVTAYPAYHFEWIKKDDLLDVFVGSGNSRYSRLIVLTLAWALVTALLVQLFVEGGRWIARRRRARRSAEGGPRSAGNGARNPDAGGPSRRPTDAPPQSAGPSAAPPARRPASSGRR